MRRWYSTSSGWGPGRATAIARKASATRTRNSATALDGWRGAVRASFADNLVIVRRRAASHVKLLGWLERQPVNRASLDGIVTEEHGKAAAVIPGVKLIAVVRTRDLAGFAEREVVHRAIEVREVDHHAHRRTGARRGRLHRGRHAPLRERPNVEQPPSERQRVERMMEGQGDRIAPAPAAVIR